MILSMKSEINREREVSTAPSHFHVSNAFAPKQISLYDDMYLSE